MDDLFDHDVFTGIFKDVPEFLYQVAADIHEMERTAYPDTSDDATIDSDEDVQ